MRKYFVYCSNCGDNYLYQISGEGCSDKLNNEKYCATCQNAIINALSIIPKKSRITAIETNEVDLNTLLRWEQEEKEEQEKIRKEEELKGAILFPIGRRISAGLFKWENGKLKESQITGYVNGKEDKKGRSYHYAYWPSEKDQNIARIMVGARVTIPERKILEYLKL